MNTTITDDRPFIEHGLRLSNDENLDNKSSEVADSDGGDGNPDNGLFFALNYLDVKDLLSVQMVCKPLCCVVRDDPLLWRCIHIGADLSWKMRDDILFRLSQRAQGNLQCSSLFNCKRITDEGLKAVLMCNPRLKRLHFRGLRALNTNALIDILKVFNKSGISRIKQLRIDDQCINVSKEQFNELRLLVGGEQQSKPGKKYFYHNWLLARPHCGDDDDREIGLELCPRCMNYKLVYDCPSNDFNCLFKPCRGCYACIKRCIECGRDLDIRIGITEYICEDCSVSPKTSS